MQRTPSILFTNSQQKTGIETSAHKQLLAKQCYIFEPFEVEMRGKSGTGTRSRKTGWQGRSRMKVDSNGLAEAAEQERDKESLHDGSLLQP